MPAKAGMSSLRQCEHLLTNKLFIRIPSTPPHLSKDLDSYDCDARHTKTRVMAEMKLQQAAAKSLSKNEARWTRSIP